MKYSCYIIDDEPLAIRVIEEYIRKLSAFDLRGSSTNPVRGLEEVKAEAVDLLFLDIEMPGVTGLELLNAMDHQPEVIVTTAYREYAVEGFELNILDYLVKPIPFPRFLKAIDRFIEKRQNSSVGSRHQDHIFVRADRKAVRVNFDDILYVQGVKDYVKIITDSGNIITKLSVGQVEEELPEKLFIRVHKSFIVSKSKVTAVTSQDVEIGSIEVPVGRTYRDDVRKEFS